MAEESAVLDAPELEVEAPIEQEAPESAEVDTPAAESTADTVDGDNRTLPSWIKNLKVADPNGYKDARATFFAKVKMEEKLKDFDLDSVRGWLDQEGGKDTIRGRLSELAGKAEELDGLQQLAASGSPELFDRITAINPEAISKLAPAMLDKFAQVDPDGWQQQMSSVFAATLQNSGIAPYLSQMALMLKYNDAEGLQGAIQELQKWAGSFQQVAQKPVTRQAPKEAEAWKTEKATWEQQRFNDSVNKDIEDFRNSEIPKHIEQYVARDPKNVEKQQAVIGLIRTKVIERMNGDKDYQDKLNLLVAKRDKEGALRLFRSREAKAIQDIAPSQGRIIYGQPATQVKKEDAKPTPTPIRQNVVMPNTKEAKLAAMFGGR